jgi:hypothetical protein
MQSIFHKREGKNTLGEVPAYSIVPLNIVHTAYFCTCMMCNQSERTESLPLIDFLPLKAVPRIEVRLQLAWYLGIRVQHPQVLTGEGRE